MYNYKEQRDEVFTYYGCKHLMNIYEKILRSPKGLITVWDALKEESGDSFRHLACLDFLVEMGKIKIADAGGATQDNVIKLVKGEL